MIVKTVIFASAILMGVPSNGAVPQADVQRMSSAEIQDILKINRQECTLIRDLGGFVCEYECPGVPGTIHAICGTL